MNQYDFEPPTAQEIRGLKIAAFGIVVCIVALVVLAFSGCAEKESPPSLEENLHGAWIRTWQPYGSTNTYSFNGGLCTEHSIPPGQPVQAYFWQYYCKGDTLALVNLASAEPFSDVRRAVVTFSRDGNEAVLGWLGGVDYILTRLK